MYSEKKLKEKTTDIIILLSIGVIGLITSIVLAIFVPESWIVSIIIGMFSCTAFILSGLESIHKTIIEKNSAD